MSTVRISDIVEPAVYADYQSVNSVEKTAFVTSGIVTRNVMLDEKAATGGRLIDVPFWKDLTVSDPNIASDDPAVLATPDKIGTGMQIGRVSHLNKSWQASNLASQLAGANAMTRVKDRVESYWQKVFQRRVLATTKGIFAANVAVNAGDMVYDIGTDAAGAPAAAQLFSRTAFTGAAFTLGDAFASTGILAVHSVVYKRMIDNDDIDFVKDSAGALSVPTYLGKLVIVDDGMPIVVGANRIKYTSVLFGAGAFGYGDAAPAVPVAIERAEQAANGAGVETLITRKQWLVHPAGFSFTSASVAGISPTAAELATAGNWTRVYDERKQVPIAFLVTNG